MEAKARRPARLLRHPATLAAIAGLLALAVAAVALYTMDVDGDGLATSAERSLGTHWLRPDTDGDGRSDGDEAKGLVGGAPLAPTSDPLRADTDGDGLGDREEVGRATSPRLADTDSDGVPDEREASLGLDPLRADTDADSLADGDEWRLDCDSDGVLAALQADDDSDGRADADEAAWQRCEPDVDADGVRDGHEQAEACVEVADCDGDGVPDGNETAPFSPLRGDSLGAGLSDAVTMAFARTGSPASPDADKDGIPDTWESDDPPPGLEWGDFDPEPGRRDLLVEFVRVEGPDSVRYAGPQSFQPAYEAVAGLFGREGSVTLQWRETRIQLPTDGLAPLGLDVADHADVLAQARYASHPYVNVLLLYPHIDQSQVTHAGIGQMRGMLAAVDYSDAFVATVRSPQGDQFTMRMSLEADPGYHDGTSPDGHDIMHISGSAWNGTYATWQAYWFHTPPVLVLPDGVRTRSMTATVALDTDWLAHVMAHELGHNLGLCHTHDPTCAADLDARDQPVADTSMMSYRSGDALHLVPSEWRTVRGYIACPPTGTLTALSLGLGQDEAWRQKFKQGDNATDTRACGVFASITADLQPESLPRLAFAPREPAMPPLAADGAQATRTLAWGAGGVLLACVAGALLGILLARRRERAGLVTFRDAVPPTEPTPAPAAQPHDGLPASEPTPGHAEAAGGSAVDQDTAAGDPATAEEGAPSSEPTPGGATDPDGEGGPRARREGDPGP